MVTIYFLGAHTRNERKYYILQQTWTTNTYVKADANLTKLHNMTISYNIRVFTIKFFTIGSLFKEQKVNTREDKDDNYINQN